MKHKFVSAIYVHMYYSSHEARMTTLRMDGIFLLTHVLQSGGWFFKCVASSTAACHDSLVSKSELLKEFLLGAQQVGGALRPPACRSPHTLTCKQAN